MLSFYNKLLSIYNIFFTLVIVIDKIIVIQVCSCFNLFFHTFRKAECGMRAFDIMPDGFLNNIIIKIINKVIITILVFINPVLRGSVFLYFMVVPVQVVRCNI